MVCYCVRSVIHQRKFRVVKNNQLLSLSCNVILLCSGREMMPCFFYCCEEGFVLAAERDLAKGAFVSFIKNV